MNKLPLSNIYSYEEYKVQAVLEKFVSKEKNLPSELNKLEFQPDFYISKDIPQLKLKGETVVEVKVILSISSLRKMESYFDVLSSNGYNLLVVYFNLSLSEIPENKSSNGRDLLFFSYNDLKKQIKKRVKVKSEENYYLNNTKNNDWKEVRKSHINEASEIVKQGNVALFLGAGVSMSAKMPSWSELLKGLMGEVKNKNLNKNSLKAFTELYTHVYSECGDSNLIMARYLETAIEAEDNGALFTKLIRKYLYSKEHTSPLLSDLALIIKYQKIDEVITYNFDDILEQELVKIGLKESEHFVPIACDAEISDHNNLPIYHVHGIIPEHNNTTDRVVFSEEVYHDRYRDTYHWSNVEQLHAMSRKHCFFVGLSMVDPNLRRLLDISRKMNVTDNPPHYAFLQRTEQNAYCLSNSKGCQYVQVSQSLIDKKKQEDIYRLNYSVLENIYRQLGVNIIWYENHDEIPELIERIFDVRTIQKDSQEALCHEIEDAIQKIEEVESKVPKFDSTKPQLEDYVKVLSYTNLHVKDYKILISECGDMLTTLSKKVQFEIPEGVKGAINNISKIDNTNGYGQFYKAWYNEVNKFLNTLNQMDEHK